MDKPTCPECGAILVLDEARRNRPWGCSGCGLRWSRFAVAEHVNHLRRAAAVKQWARSDAAYLAEMESDDDRDG